MDPWPGLQSSGRNTFRHLFWWPESNMAMEKPLSMEKFMMFSCFTILKGILPLHQKNHDEWFQPILQKNESHWCSSWQVSTTTSQVLSENRSQKKSHDYIRFPKRKDSHKSEGSPWTSLFPLVLSAHLRVSEVESHHVQSVNHDFYHLFNGNFRILKCSYVSTI